MREGDALIEEVLWHHEKVFDTGMRVLSQRPGLKIAAFTPENRVMLDRGSVVVVTAGMSRRAMAAPDGTASRVELLMALPAGEDTAWAQEALATLAEYPFARGTYFAAGQTLPVGRPLHAGTEMQGLLLTQPLIFGERQFWEVALEDDTRIPLLLVTPLYAGELALARAQGTGALMDRLFRLVEALGMDWSFFAAPKRPDTVLGNAIFV